MSDRQNAILTFWFGDPCDPQSDYGQQRKAWFQKDLAFDAQIRQRFLTDYERAVVGECDRWANTPHGTLALILVFDQFPRNLFRSDPRSFATDPQALALARHAVDQGWDRALLPVERLFIYLPFEHSETLADQHQSVALFEELVQTAPELESTLDYAYRHREVIARFGRFPHRNDVLGRATTPAEAEFLTRPGSRF